MRQKNKQKNINYVMLIKEDLYNNLYDRQQTNNERKMIREQKKKEKDLLYFMNENLVKHIEI